MLKQSTRILIVEDEQPVREVVRQYLHLEGFIVLQAATGPEALELLRDHSVDLIVLDIMLPGLDGFTILRAVREPIDPQGMATQQNTPVVVLTSRGDESDRLSGFSLGADDYVIKPFSPRELVARIKAILRRGQAPVDTQEKPLIFGSLTIDPSRRMVLQYDQPITLTVKEFDVLYFLAMHPQQVFTREQLLDRVWGFEFFGDASTVTVHIRRLRQKIERDPASPTIIHTVWGVGYKFEVS